MTLSHMSGGIDFVLFTFKFGKMPPKIKHILVRLWYIKLGFELAVLISRPIYIPPAGFQHKIQGQILSQF